MTDCVKNFVYYRHAMLHHCWEVDAFIINSRKIEDKWTGGSSTLHSWYYDAHLQGLSDLTAFSLLSKNIFHLN